MVAPAVAKSPELFASIERVRAQLAHLSSQMSQHYARRAQVEAMNAETVLPDFEAREAEA